MYSQIFITFLVVDGTHVKEKNTYEMNEQDDFRYQTSLEAMN